MEMHKITNTRDQNDLRLQNKGCSCKRSECSKNYCVCYEAKIACSSNCKCIDCRNSKDRTGIDMSDVTKLFKNFSSGIITKQLNENIMGKNVTGHSAISITGNKISSRAGSTPSTTIPFNEINNSSLNQRENEHPANEANNFITQDVVDATIMCMIAQADEGQKLEVEAKTTERMILEEFGRCLTAIIDTSIENF